MLFEIIFAIIGFFLRYVLRILMGLSLIPFGVFVLLTKIAPQFTLEMGFWFWTVFSVLTIIGFYLLWRPIVWIAGLYSILNAGND